MTARKPEHVTLKACAKINLALHLTARRPDGYHLLDSLVVFTRLGDDLVLSPAEETTLEISGPFAKGLEKQADNLILKTVDLLGDAIAHQLPPTHFHLTKNLPVSSGIGGGSADAAATLTGLNELWQLGLSDEQLAQIGLRIGADVPVCLLETTCWMRGIGEVLTPVKTLPSLLLLLVNPGVAVSTPQVFKKLAIARNAEAFQSLQPLPETPTWNHWINWLKNARNDLQKPAIAQAGEIGVVLEQLNKLDGCQLARMSGSGATCFAVFESAHLLENAKKLLKLQQPDWWIIATRSKINS